MIILPLQTKMFYMHMLKQELFQVAEQKTILP